MARNVWCILFCLIDHSWNALLGPTSRQVCGVLAQQLDIVRIWLVGSVSILAKLEHPPVPNARLAAEPCFGLKLVSIAEQDGNAHQWRVLGTFSGQCLLDPPVDFSKTFDLLWAILGEDASSWPYRVKEALDLLAQAPETASDARVAELQRRIDLSQ